VNGLGIVLETARRAKGFTQEELSKITGIRQENISRYENDTREPDTRTLEGIAAALGLTPEFLKQAARIRGATAIDAHMRRRKTAKPTEWRRLEARLNMFRLHAKRLFEDIAVRAQNQLPSFGAEETDPTTAARMLRIQWRMPVGPVRHLAQWLEAAGCLVIAEDFRTRGVDGLSQWIDDYPIILINSNLSADRMRLTLAHELGHLCLHSTYIGEHAEEEANIFAAEFLMPWEVIRTQLRNLNTGRLLDLKREWGVSMQALVERAWFGGVITEQQRTNFYKSLSARGWRTSEPLADELQVERPALAHNIGDALIAQGLSREEVAHLVGFAHEDVTNPFLPRIKRLRVV